VQPRVQHVARFGGGGFLLLQRVQPRHVGRLQALALAGQALAPGT
jgi:hypothetical protein